MSEILSGCDAGFDSNQFPVCLKHKTKKGVYIPRCICVMGMQEAITKAIREFLDMDAEVLAREYYGDYYWQMSDKERNHAVIYFGYALQSLRKHSVEVKSE